MDVMQYDYRYVQEQKFEDSFSEKVHIFKRETFIEKLVVSIMIISICLMLLF